MPNVDKMADLNELDNNNNNIKQNDTISKICCDLNNNNNSILSVKNSIPTFIKKEKVIITSISKTNLYIRGLEETTTDDDLHDMCQKYGQIKSTKAIIDKETNKCKGYGFVDFKSCFDAQLALNELRKDQKDVQLAKQREQDSTNLYFANLPSDVDEKSLSDLLKSQFNANISSTRIMREESGDSKGVGFCRIDSDKLCARIVQELNSRPYPGHVETSRLILVKLADSSGFFKSNSGKHKHSFNGSDASVDGLSNESNANIKDQFSDVHFSNQTQYVDAYGYPVHFVDSWDPTTPPASLSSSLYSQQQHRHMFHQSASSQMHQMHQQHIASSSSLNSSSYHPPQNLPLSPHQYFSSPSFTTSRQPSAQNMQSMTPLIHQVSQNNSIANAGPIGNSVHYSSPTLMSQYYQVPHNHHQQSANSIPLNHAATIHHVHPSHQMNGHSFYVIPSVSATSSPVQANNCYQSVQHSQQQQHHVRLPLKMEEPILLSGGSSPLSNFKNLTQQISSVSSNSSNYA